MKFIAFAGLFLAGCGSRWPSRPSEAEVLARYIEAQGQAETASQAFFDFCKQEAKQLKVKPNGILGCVAEPKTESPKETK